MWMFPFKGFRHLIPLCGDRSCLLSSLFLFISLVLICNLSCLFAAVVLVQTN